MSSSLGSMESLSRVFGLLGISAKDRQGLKEQCGINSIEKLMENRSNLAQSNYKSCHLLVAAIDFIVERGAKLPHPHDDSKVHQLFTSSSSLDQSWECFLARLIERARNHPQEKLGSAPTEMGEAGKKVDSKANTDKRFHNGDKYWENLGDEKMHPASEGGIEAHELGVTSANSPWRFEESTQHVVLKASPNKIRIPKELFKKLFCFQRSGIAWLSGLYINDTGGILGDQMGMGKTMQTLTFLLALMSSGAVRNALIVCPKSILDTTWLKEAKKLIPFFTWQNEPRLVLAGTNLSETQRKQVLKAARMCSHERPHLVITSYPQIQKKGGYTSGKVGTGCFEYVVLDEAHRVKNTKTIARQNIQRISKYSRKLLLTGTPFLNEPKELYSLLELAVGTDVVGDWNKFRDQFVKPIEAARHTDSTKYQRNRASDLIKKLQDLIGPYLLQRKKQDFMKDAIPPSYQFDLWTRLSPIQRKLYQEFVQSGKIREGVFENKDQCCVLPAIHRLREVCNHPLLYLKHQADAGMESVKAEMEKMSVDQIIAQSPKLVLLVGLLHKWRSQGLKALIFSHSVQMLDIIQYVLSSMEGIDACRIDGKSSQDKRKNLVNDFNRVGSRFNVMLLSIETGGEGLTLTGANKSVLFDPAWNQAKTDQAVARTVRPGQTRECECIHFLTAGAVEEKMFGKQIYKGSMDRTILGKSGGNGQKRIYDKVELTQLFTLEANGKCESLERFQQSDDGGWTKKCSVAKNHQAVVGVSRRSAIYGK